MDEPPKKKQKRVRSHIPHVSKKCGAHCGTHPDTPCKHWAVRGGTRCRMHGGSRQMLSKGDPRRGGRPLLTKTGTTLPAAVYSASLTDDMKEIYNSIDLYGLDQEVRIAGSFLEWAIGEWKKDPTGGVTTSVSAEGAKTIRPWCDIVMEHVDKVRRLKHARLESLDAGEIARYVDALVKKAMEMEIGRDNTTGRQDVEADERVRP